MSFNIDKTRSDFPILEKKVYDKKLIYLDSAASAQKPKSVINSMKSFQEEEYANVHRGIHYLSNLATDQYELSRKKVKDFINANNEDEIIFTMGATDAINLTGPIRPLSGKIVLIRYNKDGTILNKNISYSARAKKGSKRNPFVKQGDLISVKNSILGKTSGVIREFTAPFVGIYSTKEIIEGFSD